MKYLVLTLATVLIVPLAAQSCRWYAKGTDPNYPLSATFDISPLRGEDYRLKDQFAYQESRNLSYYFQICGLVNEVPKQDNGIPCYGNGSEDPVHYPAYQFLNEGSNCVRLGKDISEENVRWSLVDAQDPTVGVVYSYINGEEQDCGAMSFEIELDCWEEEYNVPDEETVAQNGCAYHLAFNSIYGCPTECGVYRGLCAKRGKCKFDTETREPHCYCQKGWTGYACNERGENSAEGFTNTTLLLVVVLVLLVFVELGVILMWDKVKRLRLDPSAYANFAAADELA